MEWNQEEGSLKLNHEEQLKLGAAAAALTLLLGFRTGRGLRRWRKKPQQTKDLFKRSGARVTIKVKVPKSKSYTRS